MKIYKTIDKKTELEKKILEDKNKKVVKKQKTIIEIYKPVKVDLGVDKFTILEKGQKWLLVEEDGNGELPGTSEINASSMADPKVETQPVGGNETTLPEDDTTGAIIDFAPVSGNEKPMAGDETTAAIPNDKPVSGNVGDMSISELRRILAKRIKEEDNTDTFKCPDCGGKVLSNTKYCISCKKKVENDGAGKANDKKDESRKYKSLKTIKEEEAAEDEEKDEKEVEDSKEDKAEDKKEDEKQEELYKKYFKSLRIKEEDDEKENEVEVEKDADEKDEDDEYLESIQKILEEDGIGIIDDEDEIEIEEPIVPVTEPIAEENEDETVNQVNNVITDSSFEEEVEDDDDKENKKEDEDEKEDKIEESVKFNFNKKSTGNVVDKAGSKFKY
jgi:ribosomal protein L37AE/L43A